MLRKRLSRRLFPLVASVFFASCGGNGDGKVNLSWKETASNAQKSFDVKFYVENSGSMNGYLCDGSSFKNVIHYYANELENIADTTSLFFLNSQVIPFKDDIDDYTLKMTPQTFDKLGGNTSSSSLDKMLGMVINNMNNSTVSVFVSDCILGVSYGQADKYFSMAKDNVKKVFVNALKKHKDLGVEIFCLNSRFKGKYYQYGKTPQQIDTQRPYYMWLIGSQKLLGEINRKVGTSGIENLVQQVGFSNCSVIPFTVVNEHGVPGNATSLSSRTKGKKAQFLIRADLSSTLQADLYLANTANYEKKSPLVAIQEVRKIENPVYTHEMVLSIFDNAQLDECIKVKTMELPQWVSDKNDMTGQNLKKTAGIKYIIGGVADAYKSILQQEGIKITIK